MVQAGSQSRQPLIQRAVGPPAGANALDGCALTDRPGLGAGTTEELLRWDDGHLVQVGLPSFGRTDG